MEVEVMLLCTYIQKKISVVCREIPVLSFERLLSCGLLLTQESRVKAVDDITIIDRLYVGGKHMQHHFYDYARRYQ
jgi:hypothetical protein